jgi:hypothetical protein
VFAALFEAHAGNVANIPMKSKENRERRISTSGTVWHLINTRQPRH